MNISNLPNDVIKQIDSFVDKRPPFADELLNRDVKKYYWDHDDDIEFDTSDYNVKFRVLYERYYSGSRMDFTCGVENSDTIRYEDALGYKIGDAYTLMMSGCWDYVRLNTFGLIMQEDADKQGIPPQTFNCGI